MLAVVDGSGLAREVALPLTPASVTPSAEAAEEAEEILSGITHEH